MSVLQELQELFAWMESQGVSIWPNRSKKKGQKGEKEIKSWTVQLFCTLNNEKRERKCIQPTCPRLQEALMAAFEQWTEVQVVNQVCNRYGMAARGRNLLQPHLKPWIPKDTGKLAPDRTKTIGSPPEDWREGPPQLEDKA